MKNKKSFSFDEERDAEKIYNDGFTNGIEYNKMYLVAKYIRQTFDYGEIRLEKELIRFCKKQDPNFNPVKESTTIRKWINSAMNYNLRKIESVNISEKEILFLKNIKNNKDRRLLFSVLIFSKALKKGNTRRKKGNLRTSPYCYIHYNNFSDIIRLAELNNTNETDLAKTLHTYKEHFTFYNAERELIRLDFIDTAPTKEIKIYNLNNVMQYYNILFEQHKFTSVCIQCGKEIKKNSNIQKYCKECSKIIRKEKQKELMRKRRSVSI